MMSIEILAIHLLVEYFLNVGISTVLPLVHVCQLISVLLQTADLNARSIQNVLATKHVFKKNVAIPA